MTWRNHIQGSLVVLALLILFPVSALAQSGLAGVVRDTSGAVLPGVTVEASSPALIEKVRLAITDGGGLYKIVDLRPGTYSVTFTLPGFSVFKREGVELPASFTATVNAEMPVGELSETITVTGAAPTVDVQSVVTQKIMSDAVIEALPAAHSPQALSVLTPGVTSEQPFASISSGQGEDTGLAVHGGRVLESIFRLDGNALIIPSEPGGRGAAVIRTNQATVQELSVQTGGLSAEEPMSGVVTNIIPKEGSNSLSGYLFAAYADENLQTDNLTEELKGRGLTATNRLIRLWEVNPAVGGRIVRDRLWFFAAFRGQSTNQTRAGVFHDLVPLDWTYTPDRARPATNRVTDPSADVRFTWQVAARHRVSAFVEHQPHIFYYRGIQGGLLAPAATTYTPYDPNDVIQLSWKSPLTNRLLFQTGVVHYRLTYDPQPQTDPAVSISTVGVTEQSTGFGFRAPAPGAYGPTLNRLWGYRSSASYITGSHNFKVGIEGRVGSSELHANSNGGDISIQLLNGLPRQVTLFATPWVRKNNINADLGVYAQDQWTIRRLSVNAGLRFDYFETSNSETRLPATRFIPARDFSAVENVPRWSDVSPRIGAAYDVFGDGRTAVKLTLGRFIAGLGTRGVAELTHPLTRSVLSVTRAWTDTNGDFVPDCNLVDPLQNGECAQIANLNFGRNNINATTFDPELLDGYGVRGYNWEGSVAFQREILTGVSVNGGYFRRWYGNFTVSDNQAVVPADFDTYCVTTPSDARLPNGGGSQACGLYDLTPTKFGQVRNVITRQEGYGRQTEVYNGFDLGGSARFSTGALVSGGITVGRSALDNCFVVDSPQALRFCKVTPPFQANVKVFGIYPLPWWGIQASATLQNLPGPEVRAIYIAPNSVIVPSLGRNLSAGAGATANVDIIPPGTVYGDRLNQVDIRLTKIFRFGRARALGSLDIFNLFNSSGVYTQNNQFGSAWLRPLDIQIARYFKFSAQFDF